MQTCNWCQRWLPKEAFDFRSKKDNIRKMICKTCCRNTRLAQQYFSGKMSKEEYEQAWNGGEWGKAFDSGFAS